MMKKMNPCPSLLLYLFAAHIALIYGCGQSEYRSASGECCPMCTIGMVVLRDCVGDYTTACKPCSKGTFMNEPNGLAKCFPCKTCSDEQGLYISRPCSITSNAVCEVMDGYYCVDFSEMECTLAVKHTECHEWEDIKVPGTKTSDTVCQANFFRAFAFFHWR